MQPSSFSIAAWISKAKLDLSTKKSQILLSVKVERKEQTKDLKQSNCYIIKTGYRKMEGHSEVAKAEMDTETICDILYCRWARRRMGAEKCVEVAWHVGMGKSKHFREK